MSNGDTYEACVYISDFGGRVYPATVQNCNSAADATQAAEAFVEEQSLGLAHIVESQAVLASDAEAVAAMVAKFDAMPRPRGKQ